MTSTIDRPTREEQRTTRPPGWVPDGHKGPGDWLAVLIAISVIAIGLIALSIWALPGQDPADVNDLMAERWMARAEAEWKAEVGEAAYLAALQDQALINRVTAQARAAWEAQLANDLMAQRWIARAEAAWQAQLDPEARSADYPYADGPPPPLAVEPPVVESRADLLRRLGAPAYVVAEERWLAEYPYADGPPTVVAEVEPSVVESRADLLRRLGAPAYVVAEVDYEARSADYPYADGPPAPVPAPESRADLLARLGAPSYVIENDTVGDDG